VKTILENAKADTVDLLEEMIFRELPMSEVKSICQLPDEEKRDAVIGRMKMICEEVKC
jgi:hypothetical protein